MLAGFAAGVLAANGLTLNGFDLNEASIPPEQIVEGGPPRDGIPALLDPRFIKAEEAGYLKAKDRVLGVVVSGVARAYPVRILDWHEIVNDHIGRQRFAVTYCPLCGSGVVFASNVGESALIFGVSGLLYNSDMLLYDYNTESLWSQLLGEAVTGKLKGVELPKIPAYHTTWRAWRNLHPDTTVMSHDTGHSRDYDRTAYDGYDRSRELYFKVSHEAPAKYHPKEMVLGVEVDGHFKAYPFKELARHREALWSDVVNGKTLTVHWDRKARSAHVTDESGDPVPATTSYWFAWYAFHPGTEVFSAR
jgi:hypothetical protein